MATNSERGDVRASPRFSFHGKRGRQASLATDHV